MTAPQLDDLARRPEGRAAPQAGRVYLHPGQLAVAGAPCTMTTILGSCVSVALFDPAIMVGGLNHYLLPSSPAGAPSPRYGDVAMRKLLDDLAGMGARPSRMVATIAGGANVLDAFRRIGGGLGDSNVHAAELALAEAGVSVVSRSTGGRRGRRMTFTLHDGRAVIELL